MTATTFVTLQTALAAALSAAPALAGGRITSNRTRPIAANESTAIVVRLDQSAGKETVIGSLDWATRFAIECHARADGGDDPAVAVDALLYDVWARLAALTDAALGASITVDPQIDWQYADAATPTVCAVIYLNAAHRTARATLTAWT